jgi:hypothetical protein
MDSGTPATGASTSPADASISLAELEAQITELAGHLNAANYRWLTLIGQFDRRHGWADGKLPSCAHWLNFKCGLNLGAARERVRVAHALVGLPKIAASMARGELSYSKVRALTRVACTATEESFLMIALHGTAYHVERLVRGYRRAQDAEQLSREARQHTHRSVRYWFAEDGSLILKARLPALAGALLIEALDAALERVPDHEISAEGEEECTLSFEHRRADAQTLHEHTAGRCEIENGPALPASGRPALRDHPLHRSRPLPLGRPGTHPHRARHSHRPRHRRHPLARRAHGLRPRSLGAEPTPRRCPWL